LAILVIFVLVILWAAVLVPPILRSRAESAGTLGGISDFFGRMREGLGGHRGGGEAAGMPALQPIIGPISPYGAPNAYGNVSSAAPVGPVRVPGGMSPGQRRRRDVLVGLLAAAGLTFLMAAFSSGMMFWVLHLLCDILLAGYIYALLQMKSRNASASGERRAAPAVHPGPVVPSLPNVHDLTARRFPPAIAPSRVEAPREATVLALRRSASW
jgi:hypothetical protein